MSSTLYNIFIFRRDLRLIDNNGLNYALKNFKNIIPIFIFTPEQIESKNKFKSHNAIQFMIKSLEELDSELKSRKLQMYFFYGNNIKVLSKIIKKIKIENIIFNMDYTPYARKRDESIIKFGKKNEIKVLMCEDYLLSKIGSLNKTDGTAYTIFTPFKNNGLKRKVDFPKTSTNFKNFSKKITSIETLTINLSKIKYTSNKYALKGGRSIGIKVLSKINGQNNYNTTRNTLSIETTKLSAYIKFGCLSIREVYWKIRKTLGIKNSLLSQLYWREFYYYIVYYFPFVLKGKNYNSKYDKIKWKGGSKNFTKWAAGETGYPVVDAGMRELNKTGYMHNRARLITSNFLNRMLGYNWTVGEIYFAKKLTDYDPSVNNGNWQWIASTGVDPKPYFQRLFNPWIQSSKFDPKAEYIKKWVPELSKVPAKEIHEWDKYYKNYDLKKLGYREPIVDYKKAREESIRMYRKVL